jgi:hypothetical protein
MFIGEYMGTVKNWNFRDDGFQLLDLRDVPTPEYIQQVTLSHFVQNINKYILIIVDRGRIHPATTSRPLRRGRVQH